VTHVVEHRVTKGRFIGRLRITAQSNRSGTSLIGGPLELKRCVGCSTIVLWNINLVVISSARRDINSTYEARSAGAPVDLATKSVVWSPGSRKATSDIEATSERRGLETTECDAEDGQEKAVGHRAATRFAAHPNRGRNRQRSACV